MRVLNKLYHFIITMLPLTLILFMSGCDHTNPLSGEVVFTLIPQKAVSETELINGNYLYAPEMKIAVVGTNPADDPKLLTGEFYSARAPEISYDGKIMAFSGQKEAGNVWQIWTLDFEDDAFTRVTDSKTNCTDPTWLPDGRIAYSKQLEGETGLQYHALYSCLPDGSEEIQITYQPHEDLKASVLKDGRLLVSSTQVYPETGVKKYLALHPDGTKAELFYQCGDNTKSVSKAWESLDNNIYFTESNQPVSINFNRPLHSKHLLTENEEDIYLSAFPMENGEILFSVKKANEQTGALFTSSLEDAKDTQLYFTKPGFHAVEAVEIKERPLPKKLPSTVNDDMQTGFFICMDADRTKADTLTTKTSAVRVLGLNTVLGEAPVSEDGSFYLEIEADQPVRFESLDQDGKTVRGPSSWVWVRPNERRGCVGCHEDREYAPSNFVPKAIEQEPFALVN